MTVDKLSVLIAVVTILNKVSIALSTVAHIAASNVTPVFLT